MKHENVTGSIQDTLQPSSKCPNNGAAFMKASYFETADNGFQNMGIPNCMF
jgi:hypothetical protein